MNEILSDHDVELVWSKYKEMTKWKPKLDQSKRFKTIVTDQIMKLSPRYSEFELILDKYYQEREVSMKKLDQLDISHFYFIDYDPFIGLINNVNQLTEKLELVDKYCSVQYIEDTAQEIVKMESLSTFVAEECDRLHRFYPPQELIDHLNQYSSTQQNTQDIKQTLFMIRLTEKVDNPNLYDRVLKNLSLLNDKLSFESKQFLYNSLIPLISGQNYQDPSDIEVNPSILGDNYQLQVKLYPTFKEIVTKLRKEGESDFEIDQIILKQGQ